ncbi:MAG: LytR/AlgR family response regulator transcription factor [Fluviicola sp.]
MKTLIIDNEPEIAEGLSDLLQLFCPEITEVKIENTTPGGIAAIQYYKPDVVFLDVELNEGTGFDLLKQVPELNFQLIFITAHDKYAVNAFRFSAIDFLVKPIDPEALQEAVERAKNGLKKNQITEQLKVLVDKSENNREKKIVLRDSDAIYFVTIDDIYFCQADGPYTTFYIKDMNKIVVSKNLKEYEELLQDYGFERTHHSFLVNLKKVKRFDKKDGGTLILQDDYSVFLSQRKKDQVLKKIEDLLS